MRLKERIRTQIRDPHTKRGYVQELFSGIAPRYDLTNDVMSLGLHRRWKRKILQLAGLRADHVLLDLAAGTGDLALGAAAARRKGLRPEADRDPPRGRGLVVAGDLTAEMMRVGRRRRGAAAVEWLACDAAALPFRDASVDRVLIGYGLRNFSNLAACLAEIRRCLRPGGRLVTLDFGRPPYRTLRRAYLGYLELSTRIVGWLLHRNPEAYLYIPESLRQFAGQEGVTESMCRLGFVRCGYLELLWGAMAVNFGEVPPAEPRPH
ncbi:MAG: ubiquinone/menaquinone biosynthesis methyltransferase [Gemmatimonadota bacterium]